MKTKWRPLKEKKFCHDKYQKERSRAHSILRERYRKEYDEIFKQLRDALKKETHKT